MVQLRVVPELIPEAFGLANSAQHHSLIWDSLAS